ncbi:uncharacterized protein [Melanerpes formicivorus]|uniref:uncharacterized protein isoform X4 n=1 Tax=Melanerpes formicivorus TaxID=211600 RepID=UPI00358F51C6
MTFPFITQVTLEEKQNPFCCLGGIQVSKCQRGGFQGKTRGRDQHGWGHQDREGDSSHWHMEQEETWKSFGAGNGCGWQCWAAVFSSGANPAGPVQLSNIPGYQKQQRQGRRKGLSAPVQPWGCRGVGSALPAQAAPGTAAGSSRSTWSPRQPSGMTQQRAVCDSPK